MDAQDGSGNTALMGVSFKGNKTLAKMLLSAGASVNLRNFSDATALIYAATFGQKKIIPILDSYFEAVMQHLETNGALPHPDEVLQTRQKNLKNQLTTM